LNGSLAIIEGSPKKCLEIVDKVYTHGYDIKGFYHALMGQFRNLFICLIAPSDHLLDMTEGERAESERLAKQVGTEKLQLLMNFMLKREEDLRFSSQPRLILETTMIKLCHIGDYLSFGDLLEKIESLERRLASTSVTSGKSFSNSVSEPGIGWKTEQKGIEKKTADKASVLDKSWDDFLNFLSTKNGAMYNLLKDWRILKKTEDMLKIVKGTGTFSSSYFDDPKSLKQLTDYCREFFEREISVEIIENDPYPSPKEKTPKDEQAGSKINKYSNLSAPVQDILDVFQGEIEKEDNDKHTIDKSSQLKEEISGGMKK
jgi:DNA polymerase-3 subunit gamma/tau